MPLKLDSTQSSQCSLYSTYINQSSLSYPFEYVEPDEIPFNSVVLDSGSFETKAGFACENRPKVAIQTVVGRPKFVSTIIASISQESVFVGEEAQAKRGVLRLSRPVEYRNVCNWDDLQLIHKHVFFNELRINPADFKLFSTEPPYVVSINRKKMTEITFEQFEFQKYYVQNTSSLALFATGRTTGVVLDMGADVSHIVPVYHGQTMKQAINRVDLAGNDLTHWMQMCLQESGMSFTTSAEMELVRDMKEKLCFVAPDFEQELLKSNKISKSYDLPDGTSVCLSTELFKCPELLFKPNMWKCDIYSITELINRSIQKCDRDIRSVLFQNVVLSGGTTMIQNFDLRLERELLNLIPYGQKLRVCAPEDRKQLAFAGGSIMCTLPTMEELWISKDEYEEIGPQVVNRKCI